MTTNLQHSWPFRVYLWHIVALYLELNCTVTVMITGIGTLFSHVGVCLPLTDGFHRRLHEWPRLSVGRPRAETPVS